MHHKLQPQKQRQQQQQEKGKGSSSAGIPGLMAGGHEGLEMRSEVEAEDGDGEREYDVVGDSCAQCHGLAFFRFRFIFQKVAVRV
ncbi:hypothetical protein M5D96_012258 [Drosophila gunungcola]|uniref:Uncharacterized protein n=1 Tax=Drosophila gunungcola TaxID=103775 RepID=A0A9Q0BK67_9MUSC|nr:hypothetical protein M5D96_012258 [Drosophila gunungcola]